MEVKVLRVPSLPSAPLPPSQNKAQILNSRRLGEFGRNRYSGNLRVFAAKPCQLICGKLTRNDVSSRASSISFAASAAQETESLIEFDGLEEETRTDHPTKGEPVTGVSYDDSAGGKPGFASFYHQSKKQQDQALIAENEKEENFLLWFSGPTLCVASFVLPSIYLRRILSAIFEDSLLTDFLILFFTEFIFYCGVAAFLVVIDRLKRPAVVVSSPRKQYPNPHLGYRISSVTILVLSVIVPSVTMGLVWPWTGPAASAALAPYLVGIIVQFAFEQYARRIGSPSSHAIPVIFQVYRLHQLNRATQLVMALLFTVRGAEMTPQNVAISSSLSTLLGVLQFLGVICIWSLSTFIMRHTCLLHQAETVEPNPT